MQINHWKNYEINYLKDNFDKLSRKQIAKHLKRTLSSINHKIFALKLSDVKNIIWSDVDIEYLKNNYDKYTNKELGIKLNRSSNSITHILSRLRLIKGVEYLRKINTKRNKESGRDLNYDFVKNEALKYKTRYGFMKADSGCYGWCLVNECVDEICEHMIPQQYSTPQLICKFIFDILIGEECEYNNRKIIKPYELDLYYPNYKLAIEYNGKYWHSDKFNDKTDLKRILCEKLDIRLIVLTENSAKHEVDIKKSIIKNIDIMNNILNKDIKPDDINNIKIDDSIYESLFSIKDVIEITSRYDNYSDFYKENTSLSNKLRRLNLLDKYTSHMKKRKIIRWNMDLIENELNKYNNIKDFKKSSNPCYRYINRIYSEYLYKKFYI